MALFLSSYSSREISPSLSIPSSRRSKLSSPLTRITSFPVNVDERETENDTPSRNEARADRLSRALVANPATVSPESPYAALASKRIPVVAKKINEGPDPVAVAEEGLRGIEDAGSPIRTPVGAEAETFVPTAKQLTDEAFEAKVKEIFGL